MSNVEVKTPVSAGSVAEEPALSRDIAAQGLVPKTLLGQKIINRKRILPGG